MVFFFSAAALAARKPGLGAGQRIQSPAMDLAALENVELSDPNGRSHRLGDFWDDRPVVLVFSRHFG